MVGLCTGLSAAPAEGAFPGTNGKIAYVSNRDGNNEIYVMNNDGTTQTRLTTNGASDTNPVWSPDGTKIAFTSTRDGNSEVYSMNADGSAQTRLTISADDDFQPSWSPDATKIAFASRRDGNYEIYTMNANGTSPTRLTVNAASDTQPAWSPNGDKFAFVSNRDGNSEIYTMNADGTSQTNFSFDAVTDVAPDWSPDSSAIVWQKLVGTGNDDIYEAAVVAGVIFPRVTTANDETEPAWSPDRAKFALANNSGGDYEICTFTRSAGGGACQATLTNNSASDSSPDWQPVLRSYARPIGATPTRIALVPTYKQCVTASVNAKHQGPLNSSSCNPPNAESGYLTLGTPDFNGAVANGNGSVLMSVVCTGAASGEIPPCLGTAGDQLDGTIAVSQTDVRCQGSSGNCAGGPLSDYAGSLNVEMSARVTDKNSGGLGSATVQDVPVRFAVPCTPTGSTTIGSTCATNTSFDAVLGGANVITEQKRAIWELRGMEVFDGGADGVGSTRGDNTLFLTGGLFFP
jgi:hypothetical protein